MPASTAIGTKRTSGEANNTMHSNVNECMMPAIGVWAPARMLVAVRAIAPVAGSPPNNGDTIFATPWPNNSTLGLWRSLVQGAENTADMGEPDAPHNPPLLPGPSDPGERLAANIGHAELHRPRGIPANGD